MILSSQVCVTGINFREGKISNNKTQALRKDMQLSQFLAQQRPADQLSSLWGEKSPLRMKSLLSSLLSEWKHFSGPLFIIKAPECPMQCSSLSEHYVRQVSPYLVSYARLPARRQAACVSWLFRVISQEMTQRGFSICSVVCQPEINIFRTLRDGLRCHSNLRCIANFIQRFKETCCLQSIWKLIYFFLIVLSSLLCVCLCVYRHKFWNSVTHQF